MNQTQSFACITRIIMYKCRCYSLDSLLPVLLHHSNGEAIKTGDLHPKKIGERVICINMVVLSHRTPILVHNGGRRRHRTAFTSTRTLRTVKYAYIYHRIPVTENDHKYTKMKVKGVRKFKILHFISSTVSNSGLTSSS